MKIFVKILKVLIFGCAFLYAACAIDSLGSSKLTFAFVLIVQSILLIGLGNRSKKAKNTTEEKTMENYSIKPYEDSFGPDFK